MFYSSMAWFMKADREAAFIELVKLTYQQRGFGDFYGHLLVAQGAGEIMVEYGVHAWDVAAIKPIVEEAGGRFSDWSGTSTIHAPTSDHQRPGARPSPGDPATSGGGGSNVLLRESQCLRYWPCNGWATSPAASGSSIRRCCRPRWSTAIAGPWRRSGKRSAACASVGPRQSGSPRPWAWCWACARARISPGGAAG